MSSRNPSTMFSQSSLPYLVISALVALTTPAASVTDIMLVANFRSNNDRSSNGSIYISTINNADPSSPVLNFETLPLAPLKNPIAVDFDPSDGMVYWSDYTLGRISRAYLNGSHQQAIVTGLQGSAGLVLDPLSPLLYFTDEGRKTIGVVNRNGTNQRVILENLEHSPRPIVVDSMSGHIYWAEWDSSKTHSQSQIQRSLKDGSHVTSIIQSNLIYPNGLALDVKGGFLYWCDAATHKIEKSLLNGQNRQVLFETSSNIDPFGIAIYKNYLYWSDWNSSVLTRVHVTNRPDALINAGGPIGPRRFHMASGIVIHEADNTPPVPSCLNDSTGFLDVNANGTSMTFQDATATDNSGMAVIMNQSHKTGQIFPIGTTTVTFTFRDPSFNIASCSFNITIEVDDTPPIPHCPNDITHAVDLNTNGTTITFQDATAVDNSGTVILINQTHKPGQFFPTGTTMVTYTYGDPFNNMARCSFNITIIEVDETPPVPSCPNDITRIIDINSGGTTITFQDATAMDNSGTAILINQTHRQGQFFPTGTTTVAYTFQDPSNNVANCSFNITINEVDNTPPVPHCPHDITRTIDISANGTKVTFKGATAMDNSGTVHHVNQTHKTGDYFPTGTTTVTYTYRDPSNNIASCSFNITIIEVTKATPDMVAYQATNSTKKQHRIITTAAWAALLVSILMIILSVIYYKISCSPCSKKLKVRYETSMFKSDDRSHLVDITYQTVSELRPPTDDYATSITTKLNTLDNFHNQDNPGYMGKDGIVGLQPRYINMHPLDGSCPETVFLVQPSCQPPQPQPSCQPPQPPSTNKLSTLKQLQNV